MADRRREATSLFRQVACVLLIPAALLAAGCGGGGGGYGGTAVVAITGMPAGFYPYTDRGSTPGGGAAGLLYNTLTKFDEHVVPVPDLAESWEVSADQLQWTFHLRKGVKFHDGVELTARDVVYTIRRVLDPEASPELSQVLGVIAGVEAITDYDVRLSLGSPYAAVPQLLCGVQVLPAHVLENGRVSTEDFGRSPVGTGPFKLQEWKDGEIVFASNKAFFGGRPFLDSVVFKAFADGGASWSALMQGKVDLVEDLEAEDYAVIKDDERFQARSYPAFFSYALVLNTEDPLLREPLFREALDLAVDREDIIAGTLEGRAEETTGPFIPGTWPYDSSVEQGRRDLPRALELLAALGWKDTDGDAVLDKGGKQLELSLLVDTGDSLKEAVAQRIKWQLFDLGIKVNVEFLEPQKLIEERLVPGTYQSALLQFNAAFDPAIFTYLFWHSSAVGMSNVARYRNPEVDRLIEEGRVEPDQQKRTEIYHAIHRALARDRPALFLFVPQQFAGMSSRLQGNPLNTAVFYDYAKDWKIVTKPLDRR